MIATACQVFGSVHRLEKGHEAGVGRAGLYLLCQRWGRSQGNDQGPSSLRDRHLEGL